MMTLRDLETFKVNPAIADQSVVNTRKLCYSKDDRAMRAM